jgi:hypothetical protein
MNQETELILSAVLRRNAHELRNKLSALISAVDVMGEMVTACPALFDEALGLLTESGTDLRALADTWSTAAREMFEQDRTDIDCTTLASVIESGFGAPVTTSGDLSVRVDRQIVAAVSQRIAKITGPVAAGVQTLTRHNLPFVVVVFDCGADAARKAVASEPILAMLNQLSAHPRVEGDALIIQMPAVQAARRAA